MTHPETAVRYRYTATCTAEPGQLERIFGEFSRRDLVPVSIRVDRDEDFTLIVEADVPDVQMADVLAAKIASIVGVTKAGHFRLSVALAA